MRKKVLVIGSRGFIGTALCRFLTLQQSMAVLSPDRRELDLLNQSRLRAFLRQKRPDIIYHLAGGRSGTPGKLISDNVLTTINLLESILSIKEYHPRVIIAGSAAEYGEIQGVRRPILETASNHPVALYGWVKLLQTQSALHYAGLGLDIMIVRLFNIIGPGVAEDMVPGKIASDIASFEKATHSGILKVSRLDVVRDFLDIRDICEAFYLVSLKGKTGEVYNICSQKGITMRQLLSGMVQASSLTGIKIKESKKIKPGVIYAVGSSRKLRQITGWQPKYKLSQSILDTLAFYRQDQRPL